MKILESLREKGLIDEDGLVLEHPNAGNGPDTGNGLHGVGVAVCLAARRDEMDTEMLQWFSSVVDSCWVPGHVGLLDRGPRKTEELISHDDPMAVAIASKYLNTEHRKLILKYLDDNRWSYNNLDPGKFTAQSFLARRPAFYQHMKSCASEGIGPIGEVLVASKLISGKSSPVAGARILDWFLVLSTLDHDGAIGQARQCWLSGLYEKFPKGMKDVFAAYYSPDHTFAEMGVAW